MMKAEIEQRLHATSKEHLVRLLQELIERHPALSTEMSAILESFSAHSEPLKENDDEVEVTEDWDFGGEGLLTSLPSLESRPGNDANIVIVTRPADGVGVGEEVGAASGPPYYLPPRQGGGTPSGNELGRAEEPQPGAVLRESQVAPQSVEAFAARLQLQDSAAGLTHDLSELIAAASTCIDRNDVESGLALYALMLDERLLERNSSLSPVFDDLIDTALPALGEALLAEFSDSSIFDAEVASIAPRLMPHTRRSWLERLFILWLKRLDAHRVEEDLPEMLLDVALNERFVVIAEPGAECITKAAL